MEGILRGARADRLTRVLPVRLLPVRHLSPSSARQLEAALADLRPRVVLVEGPSDFTAGDALADPELKTPVALFAHRTADVRARQVAWYPLSDFSPELVAFRWAAQNGATARFCDVPSYVRLGMNASQLRETPRSAGVTRALRKARARDLDELWDALFEGRDESWESFFARASDYGRWLAGELDREACRARGFDRREHHMAAALGERDDAVLVCGAVHVPGIERALADPRVASPDEIPKEHGVHLCPITFDKLRRLGVGCEAPSFRQGQWESRAWLRSLVELACTLRRRGHAIGTAEVIAAATQVRGVAALRDRPVPTLADLRDGISSAWTGGDERVLELVDQALIGERRGRLGPRAGDAPLVKDVRATLQALKLPGVGERADKRLSPLRSRTDRRRAERLARLGYLDIPYAEQVAGPRYLEGENLDRIEQRWAIHFGEETSAKLIERSAYGPTLEEAALARLFERLHEGRPSAANAARRVLEACAMGLHAALPELTARLTEHLSRDPRLQDVLAAGCDLWLLERHRAALAPAGERRVAMLEPCMRACIDRALTLLDALTCVSPDDEASAIAGLSVLSVLASRHGRGPMLRDRLLALLPSLRPAPGVHVAAEALSWSGGARSLSDLLQAVRGHVLEGRTHPDAAGRAWAGLIETERRAYQDHPGLLDGLSEVLFAIDDETFLCVLPGLRRAHTRLTPWETRRLAVSLSHLSHSEPRSDPEPPAPLAEIQGRVRAELEPWGLTMDVPATENASAPVGPRRSDPRLAERWRLVLGRFADEPLPLPEQGFEADALLSFLYDREHQRAERGLRQAGGRGEMSVSSWIDRSLRLFPPEVCERLERDALERYGLFEIVTDPRVLERLEPSLSLLEVLLRLKDRLDPEALRIAKQLVRRMADRLTAALRPEVDRLLGKRGTPRPSLFGRARDFDPKTTVARNLAHYDRERRRLIVERPWFKRPRALRRWRTIVCVDQSGSMLASTIHSAITASVLAMTPRFDTRMLLFDHRVVDVSDELADPVKLLMSVELGGGTDIAGAVTVCATHVTEPRRTLLVLVTDLYEGGDEERLVAQVADLLGAGVRVIVAAALDENAAPDYDRALGRRLGALGALVVAANPQELVRCIAEVLHGGAP